MINMEISLDLKTQPTLGQLKEFVQLAENGGLDDEDTLYFEYDDRSLEVIALGASIDAEQLRIANQNGH